MASDDPTASPSGLACEVTTNRRRARISSTICWSAGSVGFGVTDGAGLAEVVMRRRVGFGHGCLSTLFFFVQIAQDLLDAVLVPDGFVELELQLRHASQLEAFADLTAEEAGRAVESFRRLLPRLRVAHGRVVDARQLQVWRHLDAGERDEPDTRVVHRAAAGQLAQLLSDLVADAVRTMAGH